MGRPTLSQTMTYWRKLLAESGAIDAVIVNKWNRLARTLAKYEAFMLQMKLDGVDVVAVGSGQSNKTPAGRMANRMMAVFSEYQRDDLIETMQQGKRGLSRAGKVVPGRYAPYGFVYNADDRSYRVDPERMKAVRELFRMVGEEDRALWAVKRAFERDKVPTTKGGRYWHVSTLRDMILNDAYKPHSYQELQGLVAEGLLDSDVLDRLDPDKLYG
ncbi:MAG: recombinase family protein, partial [Actinobacteria bacterium]|nr:recombinase family protein [Actinomycetota bacterium]